MKKWISSIVGLVALLAVVTACNKKDEADPQLPNVVHIASQCPRGSVRLSSDGETTTYVFNNNKEGMIWETGGTVPVSLSVDGKRKPFPIDSSVTYVAGCENFGFRMYLKKGREIRHFILMPEGDGYSVDATIERGQQVNGHIRRVN
jgi:hypothetical protein